MLLLAATACAPTEDSPGGSEGSGDSEGSSSAASPAAEDCAVDDLPLNQDGKLTIGTDSPAFGPWFVDDDPTNGKGFESAVAYAVADELGFAKGDVEWVTVRFNNSYKPGPKDFDFDINQISITEDREKVVDFSEGYYSAAQGVIALKDSPVAKAGSVADLADYKLGAQTGTTSLTAIRDVIEPSEDPLVFTDTNAAKQALLNGQVEAILADVPDGLLHHRGRDPARPPSSGSSSPRPVSRRSSACSSRRAASCGPASTRRWPPSRRTAPSRPSRRSGSPTSSTCPS